MLNQYDEPFLHLAVRKGQAAVVKTLLEQKVDVEFKNVGGLTALHMAAKRGHLEIIGRLLDFNARINTTDDSNKTPLHFAIEGGHIKVSKYLLDRGADFEIISTEGHTCLHLAALRGHLEIVEYLLQHGANIETVDINKRTPLVCAIEGRHNVVVRRLLERGANVSCKGELGCNPLHIAAQRGHTNIVETILNFGASFDMTDDLNRSALCVAVLEAHCGVVRCLLEHKVSTDYRNPMDSTLIHIACRKGNCDVLEQLLRFMSGKIDSKDAEGRTPLFIAVEEGHLKIIRIMLEHGSNFEFKNKLGMTPLHAAVKSSFKAVELLIMYGANVNSQNDNGRTPLHMACIYNLKEVVAFLVKMGADINLVCKKGRVAFDYVDCRYVDYSKEQIKRRLSVGPNSIKEMLKKHMIKIIVACLPIHSTNKNVCEDFENSSYLSMYSQFCQLEIDLMKSIKTNSNNISCYDILRHIKTPTYASNPIVMVELESIDFDQNFPIYADILKNLLKKAKSRHFLLNVAQKQFTELNLCSNNNLSEIPEEVVLIILSFLTEEELTRFTEAVSRIHQTWSC